MRAGPFSSTSSVRSSSGSSARLRQAVVVLLSPLMRAPSSWSAFAAGSRPLLIQPETLELARDGRMGQSSRDLGLSSPCFALQWRSGTMSRPLGDDDGKPLQRVLRAVVAGCGSAVSDAGSFVVAGFFPVSSGFVGLVYYQHYSWHPRVRGVECKDEVVLVHIRGRHAVAGRPDGSGAGGGRGPLPPPSTWKAMEPSPPASRAPARATLRRTSGRIARPPLACPTSSRCSGGRTPRPARKRRRGRNEIRRPDVDLGQASQAIRSRRPARGRRVLKRVLEAGEGHPDATPTGVGTGRPRPASHADRGECSGRAPRPSRRRGRRRPPGFSLRPAARHGTGRERRRAADERTRTGAGRQDHPTTRGAPPPGGGRDGRRAGQGRRGSPRRGGAGSAAAGGPAPTPDRRRPGDRAPTLRPAAGPDGPATFNQAVDPAFPA